MLMDRWLRRCMHRLIPSKEAVRCRRQAIEFRGRPEASFLLRIAAAFDDIANDPEYRENELTSDQVFGS